MWVFLFDMHTMATDIFVRDFINFCLLPKILRNSSHEQLYDISNKKHAAWKLTSFNFSKIHTFTIRLDFFFRKYSNGAREFMFFRLTVIIWVLTFVLYFTFHLTKIKMCAGHDRRWVSIFKPKSVLKPRRWCRFCHWR